MQRPAAHRMANIEPFHVMEVMSLARELESQGRDIVHMEVGEPDFATAEPIVAAGIAALQRGDTHYTVALGLPELRMAIAGHYQDQYGASVDPAQIVVTTGASGAFQLALWPLINPGDEVLLTDPGYPCNRHFVHLADGVPVALPVTAETNWQPTAKLLERAITPRTRAVMIASPSNPTGTMVAPDELTEIAALLADRGIALISDEIYHGLTYGSQPATAAELPGEVFVINSFSKYFGMTGWRLGWLLAPQHRLRDIEKLAQNLFISPPTTAQHAALAAFAPGTRTMLEERRISFEQRRDYLLPQLRRLGFKLPVTPSGAFYLYADSTAFSADSNAFCRELITEAGVAATPGMDFGTVGASDHLRFAYTTSMDRLTEGVARMEQYLRDAR